MNHDKHMSMVESHVNALYEHYSAVQILVSWEEGGETHRVSAGAGNWYSRTGMAREMIEKESARIVAQEISSRINPPDDTEDWKQEK